MPDTTSARIFHSRALMPAASAASSFCRMASKRQAEARVLHQHADDHAADQQADRDQRVDARIGELQERRRVFPVHRHRDFLKAEILQEVEDRQRVGEHRQREVMPAQAEGRAVPISDRGAARQRSCRAGCRARG